MRANISILVSFKNKKESLLPLLKQTEDINNNMTVLSNCFPCEKAKLHYIHFLNAYKKQNINKKLLFS